MSAPMGLEDKKILVVDDDASMRTLTRRMLSRMGIANLAEAEGGAQALQLLEHAGDVGHGTVRASPLAQARPAVPDAHRACRRRIARCGKTRRCRRLHGQADLRARPESPDRPPARRNRVAFPRDSATARWPRRR